MPSVRVRENEYFDAALRRFKRACEKAGVLTELRRREFYEKPTQERKRKKAAAVKRHLKRLSRENMRGSGGGPPAGTRVKLDTNLLHYSELTLKASFHHTPSPVRTAFALLTSGRFLSQNFITGRAPLAEVGEVYERMLESRMISPGAPRDLDIKTAIIP